MTYMHGRFHDYTFMIYCSIQNVITLIDTVCTFTIFILLDALGRWHFPKKGVGGRLYRVKCSHLIKVLLGDLSWSGMVWSWSQSQWQISPPIDENVQTQNSQKRKFNSRWRLSNLCVYMCVENKCTVLSLFSATIIRFRVIDLRFGFENSSRGV